MVDSCPPVPKTRRAKLTEHHIREVTVLSKNRKKEPNDLLYETILSLKDLDECKRFFSDLCTVAELRSMEQRFEVALLLSDGMIYNDILERTGASSATISRVNRSLQYGADGYQTVLPRVKEQLRRDGKL